MMDSRSRDCLHIYKKRQILDAVISVTGTTATTTQYTTRGTQETQSGGADDGDGDRGLADAEA